MEKITIAVVNQKGGVGKTTTSINLSTRLAQMGKRVLLIDLDPQASATSSLGFTSDDFKLSITDLLKAKGNISPQEAMLKTREDDLPLHLIPSDIHLDASELDLGSTVFREQLLLKVLQRVDHEYTIIDCKPSLQLLTQNAIFASSHVLVPCEMGKNSLEGFGRLMQCISELKGECLNNFVRIFLTKYQSRNTVTNEWVLEEIKPFKDFLMDTRIRLNEALNQQHMAGVSVFTYRGDSIGAEDYTKLAEELLAWLNNPQKNC